MDDRRPGHPEVVPRQLTRVQRHPQLDPLHGRDWHTCAVPFTVEHGRPATVALPRDRDRDGVTDTWFRICLTYTPEIEPSAPVVQCPGRY